MIDSILEKAFPGLSSLTGGCVVSSEDALRIAKTFVMQHYPQCRVALLYGSYARGQQKPFSDLDILVILPKFESGRSAEMLRIIHDGLRLEVQLFTEKVLLDVMLRQKKAGVRVYNYAISEGVLLAGSDELGLKLKRITHEQWQTFRNLLDPAALQFFRTEITNQLVKLYYAGELFERVQYASVLFSSISMVIIKVEVGEMWPFDRLAKRFSEHDPAASAAFQSGYLKICNGGDVAEFIDCAAMLLDRLGGPCWHGVEEPLMQNTFKMSIVGFTKALVEALRMNLQAFGDAVRRTITSRVG
jgi:predicted nucleotidyltransferase